MGTDKSKLAVQDAEDARVEETEREVNQIKEDIRRKIRDGNVTPEDLQNLTVANKAYIKARAGTT